MPKKKHRFSNSIYDLIVNACLFDDFFMSICFDNDPKFTEQILRIIMNNDGLRVLEAHAQVELRNLISRSVCLDVKAKDAEGRPINIEIQRDSSEAIPRRARYHSSILDTVTLQKKQKFKDMPECFVIFITEHDVLGKNLPIYHVDSVIKETAEEFDDGSHIIYVNGAKQDNTPLGRLMHDFFCTKAQGMHYNGVADKVRYFKETEEGQNKMASTIEKIFSEGVAEGERKMASTIKTIFAEGEANGIEKGLKLGKKEGVSNTFKAISMLKSGKYAIEDIASASGLSVKEVKELQASLSS